mmetsp:Transcript_25255/g.42296  ORF Transcript_25255/g.42296 Transcript_25255/m.42296 type:complete len:160 (-) Transcript_25255:278-757(-)
MKSSSSCTADKKEVRLIESTCEFIEAAVHTILCIRGVYPRVIFKAMQKFNAPVRMSRHEKLTDYISDVVEGLYQTMKKGIVHKVELLILKQVGDSQKLAEKYIFEIGPEIAQAKFTESIHADFRACLIRLLSMDMVRPRQKGDITLRKMSGKSWHQQQI